MPREATAERTVTVQGVEIPKLGLGTWQITGAEAIAGVRDALELGYRHVDTARMYGNEAEVGRGIAESAAEREDIFLTTKLAHDDLRAAGVRRQAESSLRDLATEYVDLLLIHWPSPEGVPLGETLGAMRELQDEGKVRHLGVSNFPTALVEEALEHAAILCDQVEYHAYLGQSALLALARERDLLITAYSPFAHGDLLADGVLREIGEAHGKSTGQVALRWLLDQPHVAAVPKASSRDNRAANIDVFDFDLDDDERGRIAGLQRGGRVIDPPWAPEWDPPAGPTG
ncbi:MAG: aldo/keto reductase [Solirubrobacterales bacterium]|nr:aldo/keto reductase [Solirubrobacterales bacterium]